MRLAFDIESNGFLKQLTKLHCIVAIDVDSGEIHKFSPHEIAKGIELLNNADELIAHNGINFDVPAIQKLFPWFKPKKVFDTLVASRLVYASVGVKQDVGLVKRYAATEGKKGLPPKLKGRHSLEAWGHRLGNYKGDFKPENYHNEETGQPHTWQTIPYSQDMMDYCVQDVELTVDLYKRIINKSSSKDALDLEHAAAWVLAQQERNGFKFDEKAAIKLLAYLTGKREEICNKLTEAFGSWYAIDKNDSIIRGRKNGKVTEYAVTIPKRTICYRKDALKADRTGGRPFTKVKHISFNPSSRQHIAKRLQDKYGWTPVDFTDTGQPKIDETILSKLTYPEAKIAAEYLSVIKLLGQLSEGDNSWLRYNENGYIHGSVNPNGAVTGRATHSQPNIAQVPSTRAFLGKEARSLFTVPDGWVLLGTDASGLELRCLSHYMSRWDGGQYREVILNGDIHTLNQQAAGLPTRDNAKTFIYAYLYGAGDQKIGSIVAPEASEKQQKALGKKLKASFLKKTPALKKLREWVSKEAAKGYLEALDGRHIHVRSEHSALNALLQSAGGLICKLWIVLVDEIARERGLVHGWDGDYAYCAWVHDELQIACRNEEIAKQLGEIAREAIQKTERTFNFNCPLDADYNIGKTWAETH